jgi:hypothetical protein
LLRVVRRPQDFESEEELARTSTSLSEGEQKVGVDLHIPVADKVIRGSVVSLDGAPIADATITVEAEGERRLGAPSQPRIRAHSDGNGQFAVTALKAGIYAVHAVHPEFSSVALAGVVAGRQPLRLQLPRAGRISGVVVDARGGPVAAYSLRVERASQEGFGRNSGHDNLVRHAAGSFELGPLAAGDYRLTVSTTTGENATARVQLQAGELKTGLRITVAPTLRVVGRVLEHGTDRAMACTEVTVSSAADREGQVAEVGPAGNFVVERVPASASLLVSVTTTCSHHVAESKELAVAAGNDNLDAGTIRLLPGNHGERLASVSSQRGWLGAMIRAEADGAKVRTVEPNGGAAMAGLHPGSAVLSIGGIRTADLGNGALGYLTLGRAGSSLDLVIDSGGGRRDLRVILGSQ